MKHQIYELSITIVLLMFHRLHDLELNLRNFENLPGKVRPLYTIDLRRSMIDLRRSMIDLPQIYDRSIVDLRYWDLREELRQ